MASFDAAVELAENPNTYVPLAPSDERIVTERYVVWLSGRGDGAGWTSAQRFRLERDEIDDARAEIHAALRERGRTICSWEVGSHATPANLADELLARGLVDGDDPVAVALALTEAPADEPPPEVEVRRATTDADEAIAAEIAAECFGGPVRPRRVDPTERVVTYLAYLDGAPVGRATASFSEHGASLFGGATLPAGRGRGVFRALCRARWDDAVARGTPLAVTQGGSQSLPILTRLGFREVGRIRILVDAFDR